MSPAALEYPMRDIKLFSVSDDEKKCTYWLVPLINSGSAKLADVVRKFRPTCKIPADPLYWQIYRRFKRMAALGYIELSEGKSGDYGEQPGLWAKPRDNLFTLLSRVQNSNRFFESAKSRGEMGQLRGSLEWLKTQRKKCPYYLSCRTRAARIDAVFKLRSLRKHSYFRRRDKRVVNPEVVRELNYIQSKFDEYIGDIEGMKCALVHKEDGSIKLLDYQTRFTDETRKDGTIARFYRTWEKAGESYNTAVFLTLTSFPPSEATKHQHRESLWHVNRHFAVAWNAYISLLQKRRRAARRDELLDAMRDRVKEIRPVRPGKNGKIQLSRAERREALAPMKTENYRPKYLQVYEFQKNGMIHGHCVIFGSQWLDKFQQIKTDWCRLGQGERIHVYALHRENKVWSWSKEAPKDSRNRQPVDYLMKYLGKGVRLSSSHGLYWAVNKRFFTNSRDLLHEDDLPVQIEKLPAQYDYLGTFRGDEIPPWLEITIKRRERAGSGGVNRGQFDPLGWGGGTGPGVPA